MAKTATKLTEREHAEKVLHELEAKQADLAASRANDEATMASVSYEAHTGNEKAAAKLETLRDRAIRRDVEARNLDSAIAEAKRRVAAAQEAEARAEAARVAEEVAEIAGIIREEGEKAEVALAQFIAASNNIRKCIAGLQQRGVNSPSAQQLQSLGSRAILGAIVDSPFKKALNM